MKTAGKLGTGILIFVCLMLVFGVMNVMAADTSTNEKGKQDLNDLANYCSDQKLCSVPIPTEYTFNQASYTSQQSGGQPAVNNSQLDLAAAQKDNEISDFDEILALSKETNFGQVTLNKNANVNEAIETSINSKIENHCGPLDKPTNDNYYCKSMEGRRSIAVFLKTKMMNDLASPAYSLQIAQYQLKNNKNPDDVLIYLKNKNFLKETDNVKVIKLFANTGDGIYAVCEKDGKEVACLVDKEGNMYSGTFDVEKGGFKTVGEPLNKPVPQLPKQEKINMKFEGGKQDMCYDKDNKKAGWNVCDKTECSKKDTCLSTTFDFSGAGSILFGEKYEQLQAQIKEFENKYIPLKAEFWSDKMCSKFDQLPNGASIAFITDISGQIYPAAHIQAEKTPFFDFKITEEEPDCTANPELCGGGAEAGAETGANTSTSAETGTDAGAGNLGTGAVVMINKITGNAAAGTTSEKLSKIITQYDIDGSGQVDESDASYVEAAISGTMECSQCDFNSDGKVEADDLAAINSAIASRDVNADGVLSDVDVRQLKTAEDLQAASEGAISYETAETGEEGANVVIVRKNAYKVTWFIKNVKKMPGDEPTITYRVVLRGPSGEFRSISKPINEGESDGRAVTSPLVLNDEREFTEACLVVERGYSRFEGLSGNQLCNSIVETSTLPSTLGSALATAGQSPYGSSAEQAASKEEGDFNI